MSILEEVPHYSQNDGAHEKHRRWSTMGLEGLRGLIKVRVRVSYSGERSHRDWLELSMPRDSVAACFSVILARLPNVFIRSTHEEAVSFHVLGAVRSVCSVMFVSVSAIPTLVLKYGLPATQEQKTTW